MPVFHTWDRYFISNADLKLRSKFKSYLPFINGRKFQPLNEMPLCYLLFCLFVLFCSSVTDVSTRTWWNGKNVLTWPWKHQMSRRIACAQHTTQQAAQQQWGSRLVWSRWDPLVRILGDQISHQEEVWPSSYWVVSFLNPAVHNNNTYTVCTQEVYSSESRCVMAAS